MGEVGKETLSGEGVRRRFPEIEPRITRGNLYTIGAVMAGFMGTYVSHKSETSGLADSQAVTNAAVSEHSEHLKITDAALSDIKHSIAVSDTKIEVILKAEDEQGRKLDELLRAVYRSQGERDVQAAASSANQLFR